jgi:hypothetical protein
MLCRERQQYSIEHNKFYDVDQAGGGAARAAARKQ